MSQATIGSTGVVTRTKKVLLTQGFPVSSIPWKVPLQEPGSALCPYKVAVQGKFCLVCRSGDHKAKKCLAKKQNDCGRCGYPFGELTAAGESVSNHDCEGGPGGFGEQHIDLLGDQWHSVYLDWVAQQPAPAGFVDPAAEVRCQSLNAAQAAAQQAKAKALAKKQARQDALGAGERPAKRQNVSQPE